MNKVVENHAYEIVQFKVGQTYGEPVQFVSRKDDENINRAVDILNDYMVDVDKQSKDIKSGNGNRQRAHHLKLCSFRMEILNFALYPLLR